MAIFSPTMSIFFFRGCEKSCKEAIERKKSGCHPRKNGHLTPKMEKIGLNNLWWANVLIREVKKNQYVGRTCDQKVEMIFMQISTILSPYDRPSILYLCYDWCYSDWFISHKLSKSHDTHLFVLSYTSSLTDNLLIDKCFRTLFVSFWYRLAPISLK